MVVNRCPSPRTILPGALGEIPLHAKRIRQFGPGGSGTPIPWSVRAQHAVPLRLSTAVRAQLLCPEPRAAGLAARQLPAVHPRGPVPLATVIPAHARSYRSVSRPPVLNSADLDLGLWCDDDVELHWSRRSSLTMSVAGRRRPRRADSAARSIAAARAMRSRSSRSSPSSSATRVRTVPSGSDVGSSRRIRPRSTRARSGVIGCLGAC